MLMQFDDERNILRIGPPADPGEAEITPAMVDAVGQLIKGTGGIRASRYRRSKNAGRSFSRALNLALAATLRLLETVVSVLLRRAAAKNSSHLEFPNSLSEWDRKRAEMLDLRSKPQSRQPSVATQ
jgi:hypothetical protein